MAKLLNDESQSFGETTPDELEWAQLTRPIDGLQPLSQEWFRAHPQWATDRLIQWGNVPKES